MNEAILKEARKIAIELPSSPAEVRASHLVNLMNGITKEEALVVVQQVGDLCIGCGSRIGGLVLSVHNMCVGCYVEFILRGEQVIHDILASDGSVSKARMNALLRDRIGGTAEARKELIDEMM